MRPTAVRAVAAAALAAFTAGAPAARAATYLQSSVEQTARSSEAVVRGRVVSAESRFTRDGRRIVTDVEIAVTSAWKGAPEGRVRVVVPGGRVGGVAMQVDSAPAFEPGEEVVVFLTRRGEHWQVMGHARGKYRVEGADALPALEHATVLPRPLPAGERAAAPMPVAELERRVRAAR